MKQDNFNLEDPEVEKALEENLGKKIIHLKHWLTTLASSLRNQEDSCPDNMEYKAEEIYDRHCHWLGEQICESEKSLKTCEEDLSVQEKNVEYHTRLMIFIEKGNVWKKGMITLLEWNYLSHLYEYRYQFKLQSIMNLR